MRLFLLRHANAKETFPDERRELSEAGLEQLSKLSASLSKDIFANVAQIWHSPYVRARQTAEIFARSCRISAPMLATPALLPMSDPRELARQAAALSGFGADLLVVAHNPLLEGAAQILLRGQAPCCVGFRTGTLAGLSIVQPPEDGIGAWTLDFLLSARMLG